jgi:hypothetical protein
MKEVRNENWQMVTGVIKALRRHCRTPVVSPEKLKEVERT